MARTPQAIEIARYEAAQITVTMDPVEDIAGWTFQLNIRSGGTIVLQVLNPSFTIVSAPGGIFRVPLTSAQTAAFAVGAIYEYDIFRTNSGSEAQLAFGNLTVLPQQWQT